MSDKTEVTRDELIAAMQRAKRAMIAHGNEINWDGFDIEYGYAINALRFALGETELMPPDESEQS